MESPHKPQKPTCVCVCVCVYDRKPNKMTKTLTKIKLKMENLKIKLVQKNKTIIAYKKLFKNYKNNYFKQKLCIMKSILYMKCYLRKCINL